MMFLKVLRKLSGEAFLEDEINEIESEVKIKRLVQYTVLASSAILLSTAVIAPQRKDLIIWELGLGSSFGFASAYLAKSREEVEARFATYMNLSRENYKTEIMHRAVKEEVAIELSRDMGIMATLEGLPAQAVPAYAEKYGLPQGMYAHLMREIYPPQPTVETSQVSQVKKSLGVACPDQQTQDLFINKNSMAMIKALSQKYPEYIKDPDNPVWLLELIETASNHDMKKRANHHFMIIGSTQDGKSTLAGVIANGIAERSQQPAIIAVHDAKKKPGMKDITRWLCPFTYKIDGYENTSDWIELCEKLSGEQFEKVGEVGGGCENIPEMILIQDELNTVYGQGKGYGKMITPDTAKDAQSLWLYQCTQMAGLKGHIIMLGQSPLAGDTGLSLPAMNNTCFIAMGKTSGYILDPKNRSNYLRNIKDEVFELLAKVCELLDKEEVRYVLVRPTRGNPFVALVPQFDVEKISQDILDGRTGVDVEADVETIEDSDLIPTIGTNDKKQPPVINLEVVQESKSDHKLKVFNGIVEWINICFEQYAQYPSHELIKKVWEEKTGDTLTKDGLEHLINLLMDKLG